MSGLRNSEENHEAKDNKTEKRWEIAQKEGERAEAEERGERREERREEGGDGVKRQKTEEEDVNGEN